jgi:hypothetical protein
MKTTVNNKMHKIAVELFLIWSPRKGNLNKTERKYSIKFKTLLTIPSNLAAKKVYKSLHLYVFIYIKRTES